METRLVSSGDLSLSAGLLRFLLGASSTFVERHSLSESSLVLLQPLLELSRTLLAPMLGSSPNLSA